MNLKHARFTSAADTIYLTNEINFLQSFKNEVSMKYYLLSLTLLLCVELYSQTVISGQSEISPVFGVFQGTKLSGAISTIKIVLVCSDSLTLGYVPANIGNETSKLVAGDNKGNWLNALVVVNCMYMKRGNYYLLRRRAMDLFCHATKNL